MAQLMKYEVLIVRIEHRKHLFFVDAESLEEAEDKAIEMSCDHDFNQNPVHWAEEEIVFSAKKTQ